MTYEEILQGLKKKVAEDPLEGTAVYQFRLSGEGGGDFYVDVVEGKSQVHEGLAEEPHLTVSMTVGVFNALAEGKMSTTSAFFSGKIKIKGDMSLALKLQGLLG